MRSSVERLSLENVILRDSYGKPDATRLGVSRKCVPKSLRRFRSDGCSRATLTSENIHFSEVRMRARVEPADGMAITAEPLLVSMAQEGHI